MSRPRESAYDVVTIGGGPAGTTLATLLQREGHRCLVLEKSRFPRYHIGESLIPHTHGTLKRLGLLPRLETSHFPVKHSVRFVSPSGEESTPFYFSETIEGERARTWQVERSEFDRICLDNAKESGVEVCQETSVEEVQFEDGAATGVRARAKGGGSYAIGARVVADASGHATVIGTQLGLKGPVPGLEKGSIWGYYRGGARLPGIDAGETTIFMLPQRGWFWYIPLPDDIISVGIVAATEHLFANSNDFNEIFHRKVKSCRPLAERLVRAELVSPIRSSRRLAYINSQTCGDGWLAVGDARAFLDPIYSSGLYLAMASAELAAGCISDALAAGDVSSARLGSFEPRLRAGVDVIWRLIHAFYDPAFSFPAFLKRFPEQRTALINCLVGDVLDRDMTAFRDALASMTPPPPPLDLPAGGTA